MMDVMDKWDEMLKCTMPRYAVERAVRALPRIEAIALLRSAYREADGGYATLDHARMLAAIICDPARRFLDTLPSY